LIAAVATAVAVAGIGYGRASDALSTRGLTAKRISSRFGSSDLFVFHLAAPFILRSNAGDFLALLARRFSPDLAGLERSPCHTRHKSPCLVCLDLLLGLGSYHKILLFPFQHSLAARTIPGFAYSTDGFDDAFDRRRFDAGRPGRHYGRQHYFEAGRVGMVKAVRPVSSSGIWSSPRFRESSLRRTASASSMPHPV
jgi:hypothetical protein